MPHPKFSPWAWPEAPRKSASCPRSNSNPEVPQVRILPLLYKPFRRRALQIATGKLARSLFRCRQR
jgi:hypothetical protein